jgi:uncharacterized protein (TIGR01777 family)
VRLFVVGGTGFIGNSLVRTATGGGHHVVVLSRSGRDRWRDPRVTVATGDAAQPGGWCRALDGADAVVNLAGATIVDPLHPWTAARKRLLMESRVATTRGIVRAIGEARRPPATLVNASAVGYYGSRGGQVLDESASPGSDFAASLAVEWERAAHEADAVTRVVCLRSGMVLGDGGGVLARFVPLFKAGLGGPWGPGDQWWPWIHLADEVGFVLHAIERGLAGPFNLAAPEPVTVAEFARALGRVLGRPAVLRAPSVALRLTLGEAAEALLASLRAMPQRALEAGYTFAFPALDGALRDLLVK